MASSQDRGAVGAGRDAEAPRAIGSIAKAAYVIDEPTMLTVQSGIEDATPLVEVALNMGAGVRVPVLLAPRLIAS